MAIETKVFDEYLLELFDLGQELEIILSDLTFVGGPVWHHRDDCFYFNNIGASCTLSYSDERGVRFAFNNGTLCVGMCESGDGRLLMCERATSSLVIRNSNGMKRKVLASYHEDIELNSPNDVIRRSDGLIYFTDPTLGRNDGPQGILRPLPSDFRPVYMLDIDRKNMNRVALDFENPTCLCLSPDEKTMYIGDTSGIIWAYDVASDGTLKNGREFADLPGPPYGIKVDCQSNILVALGIYGLNWYSPGGKLFGSISLPSPLNISWGGADFKSLLITCVSSIYKLRTLIPGHDVKIA